MFINRNKITSFTILVVIIGLESNSKVYNYKKARGIRTSRGKRLSIYIALILPD